METPEPELLRYWRVAGVGAQPAAGDATTAAAGLQNARCPPRRTTQDYSLHGNATQAIIQCSVVLSEPYNVDGRRMKHWLALKCPHST